MKRPERGEPAPDPSRGSRRASSGSAPRTPAARTPAARTPVPRTPAARTPAARTPVARTRAASPPAARTPAAPTSRTPSPAPRTPSPRAEERAAARERRRVERAEVKRFTRRSRRRRLTALVLGGFAALLVVLIATAVFSPILALRVVRVEGTARLDPDAIAAAVSGQLGTPLALLDEGRLRSDLAAFPEIRSFATELEPPGTLVIRVVERVPLGVVSLGDRFAVVDAAGVTLDEPAARPEGLPLLLVGDEGVESEGFAAMADVLAALPAPLRAQVDSIAAQTRDDVTLRLTGSEQRVLWGAAEDSARKARVLELLVARFGASGPGEYDVSAPGIAVFRVD